MGFVPLSCKDNGTTRILASSFSSGNSRLESWRSKRPPSIQGNIVPILSFSEDEIEPDGDISAIVNPAGIAYVGRKHKGKKVRIIVLKGSETTDTR
jgi:hypothetical protein